MIDIGDVVWSDIAATTRVAMMLLDGLGYEATKTIASPPIVLAGVALAPLTRYPRKMLERWHARFMD